MKLVTDGADRPGLWRIVDGDWNFKIKKVQDDYDFKIKFVNDDPGV